MRLLKIFLLTLLFSSLGYGQLSDFNLVVAPTNETCTANGTLTFNVSNTTAGATMVYSIYRVPNLMVPIAVQSSNTLGGLTAGTYTIIATQSLGNLSNTQQQNGIILNQITQLAYELSAESVVCGNDGKITANVTAGVAVQYEIFSGPVTRPLQASNIFAGLPAGLYGVRVFDTCGEGLVHNVVIATLQATLNIRHQSTNIIGCAGGINAIDFLETFSSNTIIAYPVVVQHLVYPPSGPMITLTETINSGFNSEAVIKTIPLYYGQTYCYRLRVTDRCGNVFMGELQCLTPRLELNLNIQNEGCTNKRLEVRLNLYGVPPFSIDFLSAPAGFNSLAYNSDHPLENSSYASYFNATTPLPAGNYQIKIVDACGRTDTQSILVVYNIPQPNIDIEQRPGCQEGLGSLLISNTAGIIQELKIVSAPPSFPHNLPYLLLPTGGAIAKRAIGSLPSGNYVFRGIFDCGVQRDIPIGVIGYQITSSAVNVIPRCNGFDLGLFHVSNAHSSGIILLEKFNPVSGTWTLVRNLFNNAVNYNIIGNGNYRVRRIFTIFQTPVGFEDLNDCVEILGSFEYSGAPEINDIYSFSCSNGSYDVIVDAVGVAPLNYRIVEKNGQPFTFQNGNSNIFLGIPAAHYKFQIQDACGNILNSEFDVPRPFAFSITASSFCNGQPASLTLPNFSFLQYQWWKDNNTMTVLSTANTLVFPNFDAVADAGIYHVRVKYIGNPNSCIDFVLDYQIAAGGHAPNAGQDGNISYCGTNGPIDLFTLLNGNYDAGGNWQEVTSSGALTGNVWNSSAVLPGLYQFRYKVDGLCGVFDESNVEIAIKPIPDAPIASTDAVICDSQVMHLYATTIANAIYEWNGPNNFTSNLQNPVIDPVSISTAGIYTVKTILNGCQSIESPVTVVVNALPKFRLENTCVNSESVIKVIVIDDSFDAQTATYNWSGPNGYSSSDNPAVVTGKPSGNYSLTVTSAEACDVVKDIVIASTACGIPNVVVTNGDSQNSIFNLSGMDVSKLEIYNRWGRLVYDKDNYVNEWSGQSNSGKFLPGSTYFYLITLKTNEVKRGWVYLMR